MGSTFPLLRVIFGESPPQFIPRVLRPAAVVLVLLAAAACSAAPGPPEPASGSAAASAGPGPGPLTAELNQFRDNYSKQIIEIQLTNTAAQPVTVVSARLTSPLFSAGIGWTSPGAGTEVPPGQTKSFPARLTAATCAVPAPEAARTPAAPVSPAAPSPTGAPGAAVEVRVAGAAWTTAEQVSTTAADPFGVLARNSAEICVAQAAAAVAGFRFAPDLELSAGGTGAVLSLVISPRNQPGGGSLTIERIDGTPLLEEDAAAPWPAGVRVDAAGPERVLRLGIRAARCDPHAVADDKVGTLIPLRISVAGRDGVLKVDAGAQLRGRIYDFVTSSCGRQ